MKLPKTSFALVLISSLLTFSYASKADNYTFATIPGGNQGAGVNGITNNGQIVFGSSDNNGSAVGFTESNGVYTYFSPSTPGYEPDIMGVSNNGVVFGDFFDPSNYVIYGFTESQGVRTNIMYPNNQNGTYVDGILSDGTVIGTYETGNFGPYVPAAYSEKNGSNGVYTYYTDPNAPQNKPIFVNSISNNGVVVGFYDNSQNYTRGFTEINGVYTDIFDPKGVQTNVIGVNGNGVVFGNYTDSQGTFHAFTESNGVYTDFNNPNGTTPIFTAISNNGVVVGDFLDKQNVWRGFIATPANTAASVPVPATIWLFGSALASFIGFNRRKPAMVLGFAFRLGK
ncbi:MAG: PEP-CTERM sorting domain-containing protein [Methylomonas sp.]